VVASLAVANTMFTAMVERRREIGPGASSARDAGSSSAARVEAALPACAAASLG
jgi:hypothetical protein